MTAWAMDLGTSNTGLSRWDPDADRPRLVELPDICRRPGRTDPLEAPRLIPSATHVLPPSTLWDRLGRSGLFQRMTFWGKQAHVGRAALELNQGWHHPAFAPHFKGALGRDPLRTLARSRSTLHSARDIARMFMREVFSSAKDATGDRIRDLVITTPVESYDVYRAELKAVARSLGVKRLRFIDEPVAAAIGYGLGLTHARRVLVVDFGGGTLDLAVVQLTARDVAQGHCEVIAKEGRPLGGNTIDGWLLEHFNAGLGIELIPSGDQVAKLEAELWSRLMIQEARRVKEAVYFPPHEATFSVVPPEEMPGVKARLGGARYLDITRDELVQVLTERGMYQILEDCQNGIARQLEAQGMAEDAIEDVLMVGGSSLLPGVFGSFEQRYGRDKVRAWQPFEAVAFGACAFAADRFGQSDFIVHDYAFVTYHPRTHEEQHTVIVPRGTRFPTAPDLWKRKLVPTCALGEPEKIFKLVICEIAGLPVAGVQDDRQFTWDAEGNLRQLGGGAAAQPVVVPLNVANPTLGHLDPPHPPADKVPRLEISFGVDQQRWLVATVRDLKTRKVLMDAEAVVRLL
ncbi:MAG: Hsp70 family protein [Bradymonadia bacterium]